MDPLAFHLDGIITVVDVVNFKGYEGSDTFKVQFLTSQVPRERL